ncbi:NAD(P)-binding protein [Fistulina hepatica ATCC 64428]|uniref:NAD(P)-binding protein n=1 Tax=Fistulina hepatica ATCC 64428 TaxID=1128425 RepID=A0A0D7AA75_9AGAR|nr:NAD(P)-binding protein [Fistulina hepatica ATCC 64428]
MAVIPAGGKVLVSGANGFIAVWVVRTLLEKGYAVRGTVRSASKGKHLTDMFKEYGDRFEVVVVEDITKEGAFDEAVKGVDAVEHTASPFHMKAGDPQELIVPAVKGTVGMLQSVLKNGSLVKRVVVTSSVAAVIDPKPVPTIYTEESWNNGSVKEVEDKGADASQGDKYRASKTLAERGAWRWYHAHKNELPWDLVCLNPPFVFGPVIHEVASADALNTSAYQWYQAVVVKDGKSENELKTMGGCWIDVRDLARAHVLALETEAAADERIILSAGPFVWQDWLDVANNLTPPSPIPSHTDLPKGFPGAGRTATHMVIYDTSKADRIFGRFKYASKEDLTRAILADFEARGW